MVLNLRYFKNAVIYVLHRHGIYKKYEEFLLLMWMVNVDGYLVSINTIFQISTSIHKFDNNGFTHVDVVFS